MRLPLRGKGAVIGLVAAAVTCAGGVGSVFVAGMTYVQADRALDGARELRETRLELTEAQRSLGSSDLSDALEGAESANAVAEGLRDSTERMLPLLEEAEAGGARLREITAKNTRTLDRIFRRSVTSTEILRLIAREQAASSDAAGITNGFLRRVLAALKRTNRSFPPGL